MNCFGGASYDRESITRPSKCRGVSTKASKNIKALGGSEFPLIKDSKSKRK